MLLSIGIQALADRVRIPTITLLMFLGLSVGPLGLDLLPDGGGQAFEVVAEVALTMIGFLLGAEMSIDTLRERGLTAVLASLCISVGTAVVVTLGLRLSGAPWPVCLILGAIALATDPAATVAVLDETERGRSASPFARLVRSIVAFDDVWGLIIFVFALTLAKTLSSGTLDLVLVREGAIELGGSLLLGGLLGAVAAPISGRLDPGRPTLVEALGLVFLCAGLAELLHLSHLLASVAMGMTLSSMAGHHEHTFREIERIEWPFLVLFFVLAGASFDLGAASSAGLIIAAYAGLRVLGRFVGAGVFGLAARRMDAETTVWTPLALLPQAGVALGLALTAAAHLPEIADAVLTVAMTTTFLFEVFGPPLTRAAARRAQSR